VLLLLLYRLMGVAPGVEWGDKGLLVWTPREAASW